jgi:hypothetical protein
VGLGDFWGLIDLKIVFFEGSVVSNGVVLLEN